MKTTQEPLPLEALLDYLETVGAEQVEHTHGSLRAHLQGTYDLLSGWGCPQAVCLAGLFHSVYGTEKFTTTTIPLDQRDTVRDRIGMEAERLVLLYSTLSRASLYENLDHGWPYALRLRGGTTEAIDIGDLTALITLDFANRLEQTHGPLTDIDRGVYRKAVPLLPAAAVTQLHHILTRRVPLADQARSVLRKMPGARRLKHALAR